MYADHTFAPVDLTAPKVAAGKNAQVFNRSLVAVLAKCPSHNRIIVSSNPTAANPCQCCPAVLKVSLECNMPFYNPNSIPFQEYG